MPHLPSPRRSATGLATAVALCLIASAAIGADAPTPQQKTRTAIETHLNQAGAVSEVQPVDGSRTLYEVRMDNNELVYADADAGHVLAGRLIDLKTGEDLTARRLAELARIDFTSLPLADAFVRTRGKGSRVIAVFEDPNCPYCKRLFQSLEKVDDLTVHTFLTPVLGDKSVADSRALWCAKDRAAAWAAWMREATAPPAGTCDTGAIDRNTALAQQLGVTGTPTIFLSNGMRLSGAPDADTLIRALDQLATPRR